MSDELHALLARASNEIESSAPALDGGRLGLVRSAARRRRIVRHTAESFAGVGVVGVLGVGLWFGLGQETPEPVVPVVTPTVTPSPTPTVTPTPSPTPTATPTPTGPPTRAESIDDATVIARLSAPRTGEVWQTPIPAPDVQPVLLSPESDATVFLVGKRADSSIYVTIGPDYYGAAAVTGLYEIDAAGPRLIACPSARTGDLCASSENFTTLPGVLRDEATFYDTFTLPHSIDLGGGYAVTTTRTTAEEQFFEWTRYGDGVPVVSDVRPEQRTVREMGALALVTEEFESYGAEVASFRYVVRTPFGTRIVLAPTDAPGGDFGAIRWNAGFGPSPVGDGVVTTSPGSNGCFGGTFARESTHVATQWRQGGTTAEGRPVYVPAAGGNAIASAVRGWQEEFSWTYTEESDEMVTGIAAGYPFGTDEEFLAAHALYAVQGPAGEWLLALRGDARSIIWECV